MTATSDQQMWTVRAGRATLRLRGASQFAARLSVRFPTTMFPTLPSVCASVKQSLDGCIAHLVEPSPLARLNQTHRGAHRRLLTRRAVVRGPAVVQHTTLLHSQDSLGSCSCPCHILQHLILLSPLSEAFLSSVFFFFVVRS